MKSIIQESTTIAKAIEEAWKKADQPKEFSVKIFQEPKKNFFGFTKVSAKIGFFFKDAVENQNRYQKRDEGQVRRVAPQNQTSQQQGEGGQQGQRKQQYGQGQGQQRPYRPYRQGFRKKTYGGFKPNSPKDTDKS